MKTRLSLALLLLLTLLVAACQPQGTPVPQDPLEAVKLIADKQKDIKSQHIDMNMALNLKVNGLTGDSAQFAGFLKNFQANFNLNGDVDSAKEDFALKGDLDIGPLTTMITQGADKLTFEAVKVGEKMHTKTNVGDSADKWNTTDAPKSTTEMTGTNPLSPEIVMSLLKQSSKATKLDDEKIGDVDTYHYKVTLDPVALINSLADLAKSTGAENSIDQKQMDEAKQALKDATLEVDLWASKQDLLINQVKVHFNMNLTNIPDQPGASGLIDFTLTNKASKINQPVNITAPQ